MPEYRLHCLAESGNTYKPALMLNLCGGDWQAIWVDLFNGETDTAEFRKLNPMGEVPVLEHKGKTVSQSGVILHYLAEQLGQFGGQDEDQKREVLSWILFDNHKLTSYIGTLRFMLQFTKTGETEVTAFLRQRANAALKTLDQHLEHNQFAIGDAPTIADVSMCGYLFWPDEFGVNMVEDYANIDKWLSRIKALPGWVHPYELLPRGKNE